MKITLRVWGARNERPYHSQKKWGQPLTYDNLSKSLHTFPLALYHSLLSFKTSGLLWPLRKSSAFFILYPRCSDSNPYNTCNKCHMSRPDPKSFTSRQTDALNYPLGRHAHKSSLCQCISSWGIRLFNTLGYPSTAPFQLLLPPPQASNYWRSNKSPGVSSSLVWKSNSPSLNRA